MPDKKKEPAAAATATSSKKIIPIDKYTTSEAVCQVPLKKYLDKLADECERVLKLEQEIAETFTDGSFELCCSSWSSSHDNNGREIPKVQMYRGIENACSSVGEELHTLIITYDDGHSRHEYFFIYRDIRFFQLGDEIKEG